MKVLIDIKDNKAGFFIELMKNFDFIKIVRDTKKAKKGDVADPSLAKLKAEWNKLSAKEKKEKKQALQSLLLNGPVMDDKQYEAYKEFRNSFNKWRHS